MIQKKKLGIILILIISLSAIFSSTCIARNDPIINPDEYRPGDINEDDASAVIGKAGIIVDIVTTVGIVVAVLTILIIGIKYMTGSIEEKAEYKKTMIPYLIGVVMIGSISTIVRLIANLAANIE